MADIVCHRFNNISRAERILNELLENMANLSPRLIIIVTAIILSACAGTPDYSEIDRRFVVEGLQIQVYGDIASLSKPTLYIFLHGESCNADYMKYMAKNTVENNVLSIVMAKPGCTLNGNKSAGIYHRYDPFTVDRVEGVANATRSLKKQYKARKIFLIGHSGGAAVAGIILGRYPELVDGMVAIAFPANIPDLMAYHNLVIKEYKSLSPHDFIEDIKLTSSIHIIVGSDDNLTPPVISAGYVNDARERGLEVEYLILDGMSHNTTLNTTEVWRRITNFADE